MTLSVMARAKPINEGSAAVETDSAISCSVAAGSDVDDSSTAAGGGDGVGEYKPQHQELSSISRIAGSGSDLAQYISFESNALLSAGMGTSDGSMDIKNPSRVHVFNSMM